MEMKNGLSKIYRILGIIVLVLTIATSFWYIIVDRFEVIAQVRDNSKRVSALEIQMEVIMNDRKQLNEIQYNLRRLIEKNGLKWEAFQSW